MENILTLFASALLGVCLIALLMAIVATLGEPR